MGRDGVRLHVEEVKAALGALRVETVIRDLADLREVTLGDDQDRHGVVGARDLLGEKRPVVVDVRPPEDVLQHRLLVELAAEVDGLGRLAGVDEDGLAVLVHLAAAVRPQQRVQPAVVVAEAVAELEAEGMPLLLEQTPRRQEIFPGVRELVHADFLEPVRAVDLELADVAPRDRLPLPVHDDGVVDVVVPAAQFLAHLVGDVGDVHQPGVEEVGPVDAGGDDLRAGLGLDDRGQPRQHAADADRLVIDLDAGQLLVLGSELLHEEVVEGLDERALVDDGHRLGGRPRPAGRQGAADGGQSHGHEVSTTGHGILRVPGMSDRKEMTDSRPTRRSLSSDAPAGLTSAGRGAPASRGTRASRARADAG